MKPNQGTVKSVVAALAWIMVNCNTVFAADLSPAQVELIDRARAAGLAAQKAAVVALKAAEDAIAANDNAVRQDAVQRALKAAAEANEAASLAQLAAASLQQNVAGAAPAAPAPLSPASSDASPNKPADPVEPPSLSIAQAAVSGTITAGQADDTASITLSWMDANVKRTVTNTITFSAPTSSNGGATRLGTLDGLADAASVKYAYVKRFPADPLHPDEQFWSVGASGKIGKKEYAYVDPIAFKEAKSSKTPLSAAFFAGYAPTDKLMLVGKVEVQKKYKDSDEAVLCRTGAAGDIECLSGPAGSPPRTTSKIFTMGARYLGAGYSLAPTFNYDRDAGVRGIDFPVYLVGAGDGKPGRLSGGVGASWRSDTRDTAFYVFVGSPFSFWGIQ